jgi:cytidylate kinase
LVRQQQEMGKQGDVIMDGRDIGSVVFPDADVKFFMTASLEVRAMRRYKELQQKGDDVSYQEVKTNVEKRDYIDSHRDFAPLTKAKDAVELDTSDMTIDEVIEKVLSIIKEKVGD